MKNLYIASVVLATVGVMSLGVAGLMVTGVLEVTPRHAAPSLANTSNVPAVNPDSSTEGVVTVTETDSVPDPVSPNPTVTKSPAGIPKKVATPQTLTAVQVATHNTRANCWIIVSGVVYNVSEYIPYHPGGENQIISQCGKDATVAFKTKGGSGGTHSADAVALLQKYSIGHIGAVITPTVVPTITAPVAASSAIVPGALFTMGASIKTSASVKVRQTASVSGVLMSTETVGTLGTVIGGPVLSGGYIWYQVTFVSGRTGWSVQDFLVANSAAVPVPSTTVCTAFTYGGWGSCQSNGTQNRTVNSSSPSGCTGGSPVTTQSCSSIPPAVVTGGITAASVFMHNSASNCWLIISGKVYNVTQYVPFHPGGTANIVNNCGTDATTLFTTSAGHIHSSSAHTLLAGYYVGDVQVAGTTCNSFTYNAWGSCQPDNTQTRSVVGSSPSGCTGGSPATSQSCTYNPTAITCNSFSYSAWNSCQPDNTQTRTVTGSSPSGCTGGSSVTAQSCVYTAPAVACSSFTYSGWGSCQSNNTQTRAVATSLPSGCTGGSPVTSQSCTYTPPVVTGGLTKADVATHNTSSNCWLIISNKIYDVTQYIPFHPGGTARIVNNCGTDATTLFTTSAGHVHSTSAHTLLAGYYVGDLQTAPTTCSSFTYSAWNTCQSDNTQTRSVTGSSPSGCAGGSPVTSQSCTYGAPPSTCTDFTYSGWGSCQSNSTQSRSVATSIPSGCTGGSPVTSQSCTYTAPSTPKTYDVSFSTAAGSLNPTSLTIAVGDSVRYTFINAGDEQNVRYSPATMPSLKMDHEFTTKTSTFTSAGTWTFTVAGQSGTITVQ